MRRHNPPSEPTGTRLVLMQTPMGTYHFVVPVTSGPDPVAVAMQAFQAAVDRGDEDPLSSTLRHLKQMARKGAGKPLQTGLMILKQMADNGLVPPLPTLIEGTGVTENDLADALNALPRRETSLFDRMETVYLN